MFEMSEESIVRCATSLFFTNVDQCLTTMIVVSNSSIVCHTIHIRPTKEQCLKSLLLTNRIRSSASHGVEGVWIIEPMIIWSRRVDVVCLYFDSLRCDQVSPITSTGTHLDHTTSRILDNRPDRFVVWYGE